MSTREICASRLPEFDQRLDAAISALSPWLESIREPASSASQQSRLDQVDREIWRKWAEERLVEAQHYIDAVEGVRDTLLVREELSGIATDLVSFHGYARQGKAERMVHTLERIQAHSAKARGMACPANQVATGTAQKVGT